MRTVEEIKQEIHDVEVEISILLVYFDNKLIRLDEELDVTMLQLEEDDAFNDMGTWEDDGGVV